MSIGVVLPKMLAMGLACGRTDPVDPPSPGAGDPCASAYHGTVRSITSLMQSAGTQAPTMPPLDAYLQRCRALGLKETDISCLDPETALAEPARCEPVLASVREGADALGNWFAQTVLEAMPSPTPVPGEQP